jgi:hypothetical protein
MSHNPMGLHGLAPFTFLLNSYELFQCQPKCTTHAVYHLMLIVEAKSGKTTTLCITTIHSLSNHDEQKEHLGIVSFYIQHNTV